MEVIEDADAMRAWSRRRRREGKTLALVPTMGALHAGHISLHADVVAATIYINPTQFGPSEDLATYPRTLEQDLAMLREEGVEAVFTPRDLYIRDQGVEHETWIQVEHLQLPLCGGGRPGHFRGVATVVAKLFNITEPDVAVFGKKDYQQWRIISRMARDLDFPVNIVGAPVAREHDGLAMSSRNTRLTPQHRLQAVSISKALFAARERVESGSVDTRALAAEVEHVIKSSGGSVEYVEVVERESLQRCDVIATPSVMAVAVKYGAVRLIDNIELEIPVIA
eukprot:jgi/Chlat1/8423/Chrsp80S07918